MRRKNIDWAAWGVKSLRWEPPRVQTSTERSRAHRQKGRELGELPRIRHRRVRESCRFNLLRYGLIYGVGEYEGMKALIKRPPSPRMVSFITALQEKVLKGGLKHVRWPRGKGKTTWVKVAIMWAATFGHCRFMVVVEKTKGAAREVVAEIWKRIYTSPRIAADFPEFAVAMRDIEITPQRMRSQTYRFKPTYMRQDVLSGCYFKLPTLEGYPNTGAIIAFRGSEQALRGINIESSRPDFFFIDDPQDERDAASRATVERIEKNITGAVLGSGSLDDTISAVMATTPIEPDDVSEIFADPQRHSEWETETERLVVTFGPKEPMAEYLRLAGADRAEAHRYYLANRAELERGVEMMDDGDFDSACEVSAYEHALNLLLISKAQSFFAEYQMVPSKLQGVYRISAKQVRERVNGVPAAIVPAGCDHGVLAFVDVNSDAGLRWEVDAFGRGRVAAMLACGQFPKNGSPLIPEGLPPAAVPSRIRAGLRAVAEALAALRLTDETGASVAIEGVCFDGGWNTEIVASTVAELNRERGGEFFAWSKGYSAKEYSRRCHEMAAAGKVSGCKAGEECHTWITTNGKYLAFNSDYWKEVSQTSFLTPPLEPGSSSLYGAEPLVHIQYADEICGEELASKENSTRYGAIYQWRKVPGHMNHFGDTHAGVLVFAAIRGSYDTIAAMVTGEDMRKIATLKRRKRRFVYRG